MKKIIPLVLLALSTSAFADDNVNWTGFYGSVLVGRDWGNAGNDNGNFNYIFTNTLANDYQISGTGSSFNGWSGNIEFGYNKQLDNNLIGIELGGTWQNGTANGIAITSYNGGPDSTPYSVLSKTKIETYETLSARLGHIFNDTTLVYVSGGAALGQIKNTLYAPLNASNNWLNAQGSAASVSDNKTELGYALGFGIEHKINDKWALRANYEYVDFGKINFNYYNSVSGYEANINLSNSIHRSNLSAGVSYAF